MKHLRTTMMGMLLGAGLALVASRGEAAPPEPSTAIIDGYLAAHAALASDTLRGLPEAATHIERAAEKLPRQAGPAATKLRSHAAALRTAKDLAAAREALKPLSEDVIALATRDGTAEQRGLEVYTCSMVNARWLQPRGAVRNPYYGGEMLGCGERVQKP